MIAATQSCVRLAEPRDFPAIGELAVDVFVGEGHNVPAAAAGLRDVASVADGATLLVALGPNENVAGCVAVTRAGGCYAELARPGEVEIRMLAVAPTARGQGVGTALVAACIAAARAWGVGAVVLSTSPVMHAAQRLYDRMGFVRVPARDWVKPDGRPRIAYGMTLDA